MNCQSKRGGWNTPNAEAGTGEAEARRGVGMTLAVGAGANRVRRPRREDACESPIVNGTFGMSGTGRP